MPIGRFSYVYTHILVYRYRERERAAAKRRYEVFLFLLVFTLPPKHPLSTMMAHSCFQTPTPQVHSLIFLVAFSKLFIMKCFNSSKRLCWLDQGDNPRPLVRAASELSLPHLKALFSHDTAVPPKAAMPSLLSSATVQLRDFLRWPCPSSESPFCQSGTKRATSGQNSFEHKDGTPHTTKISSTLSQMTYKLQSS